MPAHAIRRRLLAGLTGFVLISPAAAQVALPAPAAAATLTTAWSGGAFAENTAGVVSCSNVVLGQPNSQPAQSMPVGNGTLGVAAWAANGFTAQLNRADTLPGRKSPGQVVIPALAPLVGASNFTGALEPYDGVLTESGGGMTMTAFVAHGSDQLIVDVTGANPNAAETADVRLWSGRSPSAAASGAVGTLAETWQDAGAPNGTGGTFGSLAAITADGQSVSASVVNSTDVRVSFRPNSNGSFRVIVAAPHWTGGDALSTAQSIFGADAATAGGAPYSATTSWWHTFWAGAGLIEANSADGSAQYLENIRTLFLYANAAEEPTSGQLPGSTSGVASLFSFSQDSHLFYPNSYWFWNLRQQVAANLSTGQFALNLPVFNLYLNNLSNIQAWTRANMGGLPGICVPESMRFNGNGYETDTGNYAYSCQNATPYWNGETITTGAEISLWIWQQYLDTGDLSFLQKYYPLISQSSLFMYSYASKGSDGLLHTISNAHEEQWDVPDPTTTLAAMRALFPVEIRAAALLNTDSALASQLSTALNEIPDYARTDEGSHTQLLTAAADASGNDVLGVSYQPTASLHNNENTGLEPVWPYSVIGDATVVNGDNLTALADRAFTYRPNVNYPDWTDDPIDAARLDLASQVQSTLVADMQTYQAYPSGFGTWIPGQSGEPMIEANGVATTAMDEALATDYDGTLRFAPAWPSGWDASGTVYVHGNSKVDVQIQGGTLTTAAIQAGSTTTMTVRNPWPGQQAEVVNGSTGAVVVSPTTSTTFSLPVTAGSSYLVEQPSNPTTSLPFAQVTGSPATAAKHLGGKVQIGLDATSSGSGGGGEIHAVGAGKCLDVNGASTTPGVQLQIWDCDAAVNQKFTHTSSGQITVYSGGSQLCLDASGQGTANGTKVATWTCNGQSNQQWNVNSNGTISGVQSGLCLDVTGAGTANGTLVELWTCNGGSNQQWSLG